MSKPESFVRATPEEIKAWALSLDTPWWETVCIALRDAVVAEKDAEFAAERADAIRAGIRADDATARAERAERDIREWERRHNALDCKVDALRTRAERAEAALADAQRAGAWEALTKLYYKYEVEWGSPHTGAEVAKFRYRHYAPPAPEPPSVRLGAWTVTWDGNTFGAAWQGQMRHVASTAVSLCHGMKYTPTPTEYAALVALAQEGK